ncbi:MAG: hypothetical protein AAGB23_05205 [Pseudomonadota bacterium]
MNGVTKLVRLDLPSGSVYLSDGGVTVWGGNTYRASDATLGSISRYGETAFGFSNTLPEWEFILAPPSNAALTPLQIGALARSPVRYLTAQYDVNTGEVVGDPDAEFSGRMNTVRQPFAFRELSIVVSCVDETEALLRTDDGNGMSSARHKSDYPGETGHDQATGLPITVTWGAPSARGGGLTSGPSGGGGVRSLDQEFFEL